MKTSIASYVVAAAVVLVCLAGVSLADEPTPHLLVQKSIVSQFGVVGRDLVIRYSIFNVGDGAAYDVKLVDTSFETEAFERLEGSTEAIWGRIAPGTNVTHTMVIAPQEVGTYTVSASLVTFKHGTGANEPTQTTLSTMYPYLRVITAGEFDREHSSHPIEWIMFTLLALVPVGGPLFLWRQAIGNNPIQWSKRK